MNGDMIMMVFGFGLFDTGLVLAVLGFIWGLWSMMQIGIAICVVLLAMITIAVSSSSGFAVGFMMLLFFMFYAVAALPMLLIGCTIDCFAKLKRAKR